MGREDVAIGALAAMFLDLLALLAFWSPLFNFMYDAERVALSPPFAAVGLVAWFVFVLAAGAGRDAA